jgi:hypothetical protein
MAEATGLNPVKRGFDPRRGYQPPRFRGQAGLLPASAGRRALNQDPSIAPGWGPRSRHDRRYSEPPSPRCGEEHGRAVADLLQSLTVPIYVEEEPDEDPDEPEQPADGAAPATHIPSVGMPNREWEYSTEVLTVAQVADGATLVKVLQAAGADGWELADVVDGGEKRVLLMRRSKRSSRESRRVGFAPPAHN